MGWTLTERDLNSSSAFAESTEREICQDVQLT